ncbi:MAG TPA: mannonate dehydratase [Longimicrobiales bacterium]|nr:mannonate dehydratase [Longimicrobiales bacterium]
MKPSFRWFGDDDVIPLEHIRQIPGVETIVSAVYDVKVGEAWTKERVSRLQQQIAAADLTLGVVESIPVHEDIKLGNQNRERWTDNYCESIRVLGELGIPVLCYNFMPVFDWTRTDLHRELDDGSFALAYDDQALSKIDLGRGTSDLPGWAAAYSADELAALLAAYKQVDVEKLWDNLVWFLERVVPAAESAGVRMAIHPDDPPWPIFGLPRIMTNAAAIERLLNAVDSPANGITFCTGSLGASADNDLPNMIRAARERIPFVHCRNVKRSATHDFQEVAHPSRFGDVDMLNVMRALRDIQFDGYMRPDHGRMIWGEEGRPGYGLYDRALGAMYLQGLWEAVDSER